MAVAARAAMTACLLSLAGCSTPERRLAQGVESALSWTATVHEVARQWTARLVPAPYARAALHSAHRSLEKQRASLAASPRDMADEKMAAAATVMASMAATIARMASAVERSDAAGLLDHERALYEAERRLMALAGGSGP